MQTGWQEIEGKDYYLYDNGEMATEWIEQNGEWYYLNKSGENQTGWVKEDEDDYCIYMGNGKMAAGCRIGNAWYYLSEESGKCKKG